MIVSHTTVKVRFAETDAMGVVYHANYLPWCECARLQLMDDIGMSYVTLCNEGYHLPVVEEQLNYKHPAVFGDSVEIKAVIAEKPTVKIRVDYEMYAGGKLLVCGHTLHVFVNAKGMPVKPPKAFLDLMSKHF